jgi:probable rRNA maturation factor
VSEPAPVVVAEDRSGMDGRSPDLTLDSLAGLMALVLNAEGVSPTAEAGLHLVDVGEITEMNLVHMGINGPTDVLSFPVDGPAPDGKLVGDVLVCPQVAFGQASEHAGTELDELRLLVVHGTLHLCGWDHADEAQRHVMWQRERDLMTTLEVPPSRDAWTT